MQHIFTSNGMITVIDNLIMTPRGTYQYVYGSLISPTGQSMFVSNLEAAVQMIVEGRI